MTRIGSDRSIICMSVKLNADVLVFGGGIAGLWLAEELLRQGCNVLLVENRALGSSQTVGSQGIIHGGLKYMFDGNFDFTRTVKAIAEMPVVWRDCLAGRRLPNLSATRVNSDGCYIWGTGSIKSRIFLAGSTMALRAAPQTVEREQWPEALRQVSGKVMWVAEQVVDTLSLVGDFARQLGERILLTSAQRAPDFAVDRQGRAALVTLYPPEDIQAEPIEVTAQQIVFTAGEGNQQLRESAGLKTNAMQRRPLHMVMARGTLPNLFGHCVGGPKPRVTITTVSNARGQVIWQVGGQIAEDGVKMSPAELARHGRKELSESVPGLDLSKVEIATYSINRAEAVTEGGHKPDDVHVMQEGNIITAWPTKLALAPRLTERVCELLSGKSPSDLWKEGKPRPFARPAGWRAAPIALPPWEKETQWFSAQ